MEKRLKIGQETISILLKVTSGKKILYDYTPYSMKE